MDTSVLSGGEHLTMIEWAIASLVPIAIAFTIFQDERRKRLMEQQWWEEYRRSDKWTS